jgi:hypothetical protein
LSRRRGAAVLEAVYQNGFTGWTGLAMVVPAFNLIVLYYERAVLHNRSE